QLDLVTANRVRFATSVSVLLSQDDGTFAPAQNLVAAVRAERIAAVDVNGDNKVDLLVTSFGESRLSVLLGNGNGTFQPRTTFPAGSGDATGLAVADVNGDGNVDAIVTGYFNATATVLLGDGLGHFVPQPDLPVGDLPYNVTAGDF